MKPGWSVNRVVGGVVDLRVPIKLLDYHPLQHQDFTGYAIAYDKAQLLWSLNQLFYLQSIGYLRKIPGWSAFEFGDRPYVLFGKEGQRAYERILRMRKKGVL